MKTTKKILSVLLALLMIISIIPMSSITASAANGIQAKIDELREVYYTGTYFTASGGPCYNSGGADCALSNIPSRGGLPAGSTASNAIGNGWSCNGFARYTFYYVFGKAFGTSTVVSNPSLGDIIETRSSYGTHYSMYLGEDTNNYYVYDSNGTSAIDCSVRYNGALAKSKHTLVKAYHATNYDSVNGSTPTPPINFVTGLQGDYYLQGKNTGDWLSVSENKDASTQPINTWGTWYKEFRVNLTASGNGYKINFPLISSLLMNPYSDYPTIGTKVNLYQDVNDITQQWGFEKVGDAYAIRSMYNTSLCLTDNGVNQATLTTYTGAANQLWYLHPYSYTVSYNANGGTGAPSSQTKYFNESLTLSSNTPTRNGYTFLGWSESSTATTPTYSAGSSFTTNANTTLYAVWKQDVKTYTISYDANGGTGAPASQQKTYETSLTLSSVEPTKDGYLFLGWTTDDTNTIEYLPGDTFAINSDTTLYAVWVEISELILNNEWTVWTSTDIWVTSLSVAPGSDKPDVAYYYVPQKTGKYIFYSTNASDSEIYLYNDSGEQIGYDDDSGENLNFRLECDLVAGKEYTFLLDGVSGCNVGFGEIYAISYDANGGTGAPQSQQRAFNEVLILSDKIPNRSGYTFLGWSDSGPSGGVTYQPGGEMRYLAQDITLYAVWQKNTIDENAPAVVVSSNKATAGSQIKIAISLKNNPGIVSMILNVNYDANKLKLVSVEDSGKLGTAVHSDGLGSPYVLCWVNDTATENFTYNGEIAVLTFKVMEDAELGETPITITYNYDDYEIIDKDMTPIKFETVNGSVNIIDVIIGDVNNDGKVNTLDRVVLTRYLAKWTEYPEGSISLIAADVNNDGKVNTLDRVILTRYLAKWEGYDALPYIV